MGWYGLSAIFVFSSLCLCFALDPRLTQNPQQWAIVRRNHSGRGLTDEELRSVAQMGNYNHFQNMLSPILIPRVPDTPGSIQVRKHLVDEMRRLQWQVEEDQFYSSTPLKQQVSFTNVIATLNPNAPRRLVLACHYDSLMTRSGRFVGATDSAVPCAQMLSLANDLKDPLSRLKLLDEEVTLQFIFFDGEEAFVRWTRTDSTYGSRHLAQKLQKQPYTDTGAQNVNHLHRIDLFVLLDLIGVSDPTFYSYFRDSESWYSRMASIEFRLRNLNLMRGRKAMFKKDSWYNPGIEDDHIPFLERGVPILHLIPYPFPRGWHKDSDDEKSLDPSTIQNFNAILRAFVTDYLHLDLA